MVYLEFGKGYVRGKDEAGVELWRSGEKNQSPVTRLGIQRPISWPHPLLSHRGILVFSDALVRDMVANKTRLPFPDDTQFYGAREAWESDSLWVKVMHPDLHEVLEGWRLPLLMPVFEDGPDNQPVFVSWGM